MRLYIYIHIDMSLLYGYPLGTADDINPASPIFHYTIIIPIVLVCKVMHDLPHEQYVLTCNCP